MAARISLIRSVLTFYLILLLVVFAAPVAAETSARAPGTVYIVNSLADTNDGVCDATNCTLREAMQTADASLANDTITFANSGTIHLLSSLPAVRSNDLAGILTIDTEDHTVWLDGDANNDGTPDVDAVIQIGENAELAVIGLKITKAGASGSALGGAFHVEGGLLELEKVQVTSSVGINGGAIQSNQGRVRLKQSSFYGNQASQEGGAIAAYASELWVENSTFASNSASTSGGAIAGNQPFPVQGEIVNTTLIDNHSSNGGALSATNGAGLTVSNSIITNGTFVGANCYTAGGSAILDGGNNIDRGTSCGFDATVGSMENTDPLIQDAYAGMSFAALLPGSLAIDGVTVNAPNGCPTTDQRGISRDTVCDIGAFESRKFNVSLYGGNNQGAEINQVLLQDLDVIVTSAFAEPVQGGVITFSGPATGASAVLTPAKATIGSNGHAVTSATANSQAGTYQVSASAQGTSAVNFTLTNALVCFEVTANANPAGGGTVTTAPAPNCGLKYLPATPMTVTADHADGYFLKNWTGMSGKNDVLNFNVNADTNLLANFIVNQLKNPDFELDANGDGKPDAWSKNAAFKRSAAKAQDGAYAAKLTATNNVDVSVSQTVKGIEGGQRYTFRQWLNIPATTNVFTVAWVVEWRKADGTVLKSQTVQEMSAATQGWKLSTKTIKAPSEAAKVVHRITARSVKAQIYLDSFGFGK